MKQNIFAFQVTNTKFKNILITSNWETSSYSLTIFWTSSYSTDESQFNILSVFFLATYKGTYPYSIIPAT